MTKRTARSIVYFADTGKKKIQYKAVSAAAKTTEDTESMTKKPKFFGGDRGDLRVKAF